MAAAPDRTNADLRRRLAVDAPPTPQIAKEKQGMDTEIPLSPQWLMKVGENKEPISHGIHSDVPKTPGNGEDPGLSAKKKDVFRASVLDGETGRHDRWRDDEREPNSTHRWSRWRETDKELGDTRKVERWSDDSNKYSVDGRRTPQERWGDSNNKEGNYDQRREKWSTRWGSNEKESENWRDRWGDSGKEGDTSCEKSFSHYAPHGKDGSNYEKDTERDDSMPRSWKSSYPVGRGRGDMSHYPSQTPQKSSTAYGYGRGKPDNEISNLQGSRVKFTSGTGAISSGSSRPFHLGLLSDRPGGTSGDRSAFRYSRMKLLDIYRTGDLTNFKIPVDGFEEFSVFMQEEASEPLALSAPVAEEAALLKAIEKGDIVNSGVHQASKDGSVGKGNPDLVEKINQEARKIIKEKRLEVSGVFLVIWTCQGRGESLRPGPSTYVVPQRSQLVGEHRLGPSSEFGQVPNFLNQERSVGMARVDGFPSPMQPHPNPESLSLYYKDPQGQIQGPFSGADIIGWFEAGYFAKARPPPGFATSKPSDMLLPETPSTGNFASSSTLHAGSAPVGILDSGSRKDNPVEAQNRFLESLMSNNIHNNSASLTGGSSSFGNIAVGGGDALPAAQAHNKDIAAEASILHSKLLPPMSDPSRQSMQSQNVDLLAMLHSKEKPQLTTGNSGLPLWPNYTEARNVNANMHGVDINKGLLNTRQDLQQNSQNIGIGAQQHGFMPQNRPALASLPPEKLLSEISQDPQLLNVLQQQYLMSQLQLQSQPSLTAQPQLSMLDKMLLLKQQQQQQQQQLQQQLQLEQQQKVLLQQQHLLSHMVPQGRSSQQPEDSYGSRHPSVPSGDSLNALRRMQESIEIDRKLPVHGMQVGQQSSQSIMNMRDADGIGLSQISATSLPLPHEIAVGSLSKEGYSHPQMPEVFANDDAQMKATMVNPLLERVTGTNDDQSAVQEEVKSHEMGTGTRKAVVSETAPNDVSGRVSMDVQPSMNPKSDNILANVSKQVQEIKLSAEAAPDEVKVADTQETKKADKKKKQKKKQAASDTGKGTTKTVSAQQSKQETEADNSDVLVEPSMIYQMIQRNYFGVLLSEWKMRFYLPKACPRTTTLTEAESESDPHSVANQRAWKPTQGPRPKSLLEIQAEEQLRAQRALAIESAKSALPATSVPSIPWNGMAMSSELHIGGASKSLGGMESASERSKRSQLHDLLAEEVLARSSVADNENISNASDALFPPLSAVAAQPNAPALDDSDFIEAKDKKSKKKATKAKGSTVKAPSPVGSFDQSAITMPTEKGKSAKQAQQESEILPAPPSGPSFGDFVLWKSDANSVPAPAWSNDSAKVHKPLSLRDIQREEERRLGAVKQQAPLPAPVKSSVNQKVHGNAASWQASGSSSSKTVTPVQMSSNTPNRSKSSAEDDFFWGPSDNSKQDKQQSEFPSLSSQSRSSTMKDQSPLNRQKSQAGRLPLSSAAPANQSGKAKAQAANKQTEAMDFRDWCESEWLRLTGTNDTSFLEFCIKQSTVEAEMLLQENIGSLDRNHEFIDKFLNYKAFLSAEVIEMAFRAPSTRGPRGDGAARSNPGAAARGGTSAAEMEQDGGGKKKGKKGKKVSAAVLGFNVVSNRIMMGEIQNVE
ncbi:hypothetical protein PR202_gb12211 [Eleusine coracana subsp. coracana]|uniref:GYF domain-containing protein n=1 Tax=Eleusine coracana subsp. coracana TaxID=191504 RepID=A0AAV5EPH1_ELECO|nr:hypothetical protein PR202_gb12211 [Eleusine coracana subsp. coracana]